jgi:hypothetical protein
MCRTRNHSHALRNHSHALRNHNRALRSRNRNRKLRGTASPTSRRAHRPLIQAVVVVAVRVKAKSRKER